MAEFSTDTSFLNKKNWNGLRTSAAALCHHVKFRNKGRIILIDAIAWYHSLLLQKIDCF